MITLSIYFGFHDSSVTIASEKSILLHLESERYFRKKHMRFNHLSELEELTKAALDYCDLTISDVDKLLVSKWNNLFEKLGQPYQLLGKAFEPTLTSHHMNHVACVAHETQEDCLIVCADGGSEDGFSKIYLKSDGDLSVIDDLDATIMTGKFYGTLTQIIIEPHCSKAHNHDAGKLMGLASLGTYSQELYDLIEQHKDEINKLHFDGCEHLNKLFGISDDFSEPWLDQRRCDLAYTGQKYWVDTFFERIASHADKSPNLALTGGCALNVVLNTKLAASGIFKQVITCPVPNDSGQSLGALLASNPALKHNYPFLGRTYGDVTKLPEQLLDDLRSEKIVAWYQGASEIGPRALGHRSFIGLPTTTALRDRLSKDIKKREPYRPVAPIVMKERLNDFFVENVESPYMSYNHRAKTQTAEVAPAIVHSDGTSRVQTLSRDDNPVIHELLEKLQTLGYPPIIMNSSFNVAGAPIVDTPEDAKTQFMISGADVLYINGVRYEQGDFHD